MRLVALAATFASGCSFFALSTPHERPAAPPLRCQTTNTAPVVDAVVGGLALVLGGATIIADLSKKSEFQGIATVYLGLPLVGVGTLYGLSSTYGFVQTSRCRRYHRELGIPYGPAVKPAPPVTSPSPR